MIQDYNDAVFLHDPGWLQCFKIVAMNHGCYIHCYNVQNCDNDPTWVKLSMIDDKIFYCY